MLCERGLHPCGLIHMFWIHSYGTFIVTNCAALAHFSISHTHTCLGSKSVRSGGIQYLIL